jgi:hypothetical protein
MHAMKTSWGVAALLALPAMLGTGGCKKDDKGAAAGADLRPAAVLPALQPTGMADPFARTPPEAGKALERGHKALRGKKWDEAQTAFKQVITLSPDHTAARWGLLRALALSGTYTEIPVAYEALIARDWAGFANRFEKGKEYTGLRNAPEYAHMTALKNRYREAYAKGLEKGFLFVARTRPDRQEVFHHDTESKRFRRLTETDGRLFAINRAADGKSLTFLVAPQLERVGTVDVFVDPKVGVLDLTTLETVGPFAQKGRFDQVMLGANKLGQPLFTFVVGTGASVTYTLDTAKSGLAKLEGEAVIPTGGETRAWANQVAHIAGKAVDGVKITDGANTFTIDGVPTPITAARPLAQSSLDWSPGKTRLTYAGKLDACKILKSGTAEKNELYVYDMTKKTAQRVAAAVSSFETLWLDDDRLVYEGGVGKDGQLHLYAFTAHADSSLPTRYGAGLYGVPTLQCEQAETGVDEDLGESEGEGD